MTTFWGANRFAQVVVWLVGVLARAWDACFATSTPEHTTPVIAVDDSVVGRPPTHQHRDAIEDEAATSIVAADNNRTLARTRSSCRRRS